VANITLFGTDAGAWAVILLWGRTATLVVDNSDATRARLRALQTYIDDARAKSKLDIVGGIEHFPDPEVTHEGTVTIHVTVGFRINSRLARDGIGPIAGMIDEHRTRIDEVGEDFWSGLAKQLGAPFGAFDRPTSVESAANPRRPRTGLFLVHASWELGCRYSFALDVKLTPADTRAMPTSVKGFRRGVQGGLFGYHRWVESTTQLLLTDGDRKRMADTLRPHGTVHAWLETSGRTDDDEEACGTPPSSRRPAADQRTTGRSQG
jgi:hypothetical protein